MKPLLVTAGVLALAAAAAACGSPERVTYDAPVQAAETETATTVPGEEASGEAERQVFMAAADEMEASDLIGASVHNAAGEEIATVADIQLAEAGGSPKIILRDGGVAGVGGELRMIAFNAADIVPDPETDGDEPNLIVQFTGETLKTLPKFEQAVADDYSLASEVIGTTAPLSFSGDSVRINDLILTRTGEAKYAVITPDLVSTEQIVVEAKALKVAQGDTDEEGALTLDLTADALSAAPEYPRE